MNICLMLSKLYLFTNWCTSELFKKKKFFKFTFKFTLKQLWHVSVQSHHHHGVHYSCLLKLQLLKQSIKIHRCVVNTVVVWLHILLLPSTAEQCNIHTNKRTQTLTHTHTHTHTNNGKSSQFRSIHFVLENPINTVLDTLLYITDPPIYAATPPLY